MYFKIMKSYFQVAYTFDAGPNACLYLLEKDVTRVLSLVTTFFPPKDGNMEKFIHGIPVAIVPPSPVRHHSYLHIEFCPFLC